jgi:hypothetical protein
LLCVLRYGLFWRKFHELLKRMHIVLLQGGMFCRHLSVLLDLWCHLILGFLCWFFIWMTSIADRGVLKSFTTTMLGIYMCFKSFGVCLMKLGALTLCAYKLITVISSCYIAPFISIKWPSLSLLNNLCLKSTLSVFWGH